MKGLVTGPVEFCIFVAQIGTWTGFSPENFGFFPSCIISPMLHNHI
jgi:hypothetical protein